jgi:hypothetical protein
MCSAMLSNYFELHRGHALHEEATRSTASQEIPYILRDHKVHCGGTLLVTQLVEALRYKPEGRGFDSQWCHWNFSFT